MTVARAYDNAHSRRVAWLKVILPLTAIGLLSTLFLFSRAIDPEAAIPYADVDVADRLAQPRMVGVGFSGTLADGTAISLTADEAKPEGEEKATVTGVRADLTLPAGAGAVSLTAARIDTDGKTEAARLSGGVRLQSSNGYLASAEGFDIGLRSTVVTSHGAVMAEGPLGRIEAGALTLSEIAGQDPRAFVLVFNDRVRVVYRPAKD